MSASLRWPSVIAISAVALGALVLADADSPVRLALALWFLLLCPGMALAPLLPVRSASAQLALGIALSLAIDTAVTTAMLVTGSFSLATGLLALYAVCLAGCGLQARRWAGARGPTEVRLLV